MKLLFIFHNPKKGEAEGRGSYSLDRAIL